MLVDHRENDKTPFDIMFGLNIGYYSSHQWALGQRYLSEIFNAKRRDSYIIILPKLH